MFIKNNIILILVIYIIYISIFNGYFRILPTIPIYPNNKKEIQKLKNIIKKRNRSDIEFFYLTNESVSYAFKPYVFESINQLNAISTSQNFVILLLKYIINRARPEQIDKNIIPLNKNTAMTPAYPAGHSYQAYLLSKYLSKKYPNKRELFRKIALRCDDCRVKAGLHYPSDGEFSRYIVDIIN